MLSSKSSEILKDEVSTAVDVDAMLAYAGNFGKYQKQLIALFSFINILSAYHYFGQTFITINSDFECERPAKDNFINITVSQCSINFYNGSELIENPCTQWKYNNSYGFVSIVQELNWVCNNDWKPALGQSLYFIGSVIGSLFFGVFADKLGRLHALVGANFMAVAGNLITLWGADETVFAVGRFIAGSATDANFVMMYIIVMEYIPPRWRTLGLNLTIGIFYCIASMMVPWTAVWLKTWRFFLLALTVPHMFVVCLYFFVPESAQWLLSKNQVQEAIKCFQKIAKVNGKVLSVETIQGLERYAEVHIHQENQYENIIGLLKTPKLRKKTLILIFKSMIMTLGYDAIAKNVNGFHMSPFIIFTASSATILPGCCIILAMQDRIGRKAMASGSLLMSGIFMICIGITFAVYTDQVSPIITISFIVVARLGTIMAFNSGAQYAVELIPTVVRGQGVSVIHVVGLAATTFSPQILYLANFWRPLPEVTLGVLLIAAAIACLFLPETLNKTLPVTLEDGENFGEDEGIFEFAFSKRRKTESTCTLAS